MVQTYTTDCYAAGHVVDTDQTNVENNFAALKSSFSGAVQPGNTVAGMFWMDTNKNLLKVRNFNDTAWLGIMQASTSHKIFVYRNDAETGWAIDAGSTDRVIVLKGGATYLVGGTEAGSWDNGVGLTKDAHTHAAGTLVAGNHFHILETSGTTAVGNFETSVGMENVGAWRIMNVIPNGGSAKPIPTGITGNPPVGAPVSGDTGAQSGAGISSDSSWRVAAAITTMQYLDV